jgi:CheY-like chemotaxis protein
MEPHGQAHGLLQTISTYANLPAAQGFGRRGLRGSSAGGRKMNGYKVCQLLKADPKYKTIPIIISSGRTPQEIRKVGKEVGADAFVSKPFEAEELLTKKKELLEKNRK